MKISNKTDSKKSYLFQILLVMLLSVAGSLCFGAAGQWSFNADPNQSQVDFHAIGRPAMIKIHGIGKGVKGGVKSQGGKTTGQFTFGLDSLDTGINLRNHHMKEKYLQTDKYPQATLTLDEIKLPATFPNGDASLTGVPFKGKLTVHGVTKPIDGQADIKKTGDSVNSIAHFSTKISDYKIDVPNFKGITVADKVNVDVTAIGKISKP